MKSLTEKVILTLTTLSGIIALALIFLYRVEDKDLFFTLAITFGTITYHFTVRLLIGWLLETRRIKVTASGSRWAEVTPVEMKFYEIIKIKKWKGKLPTYIPDHFNLHKHTAEEVMENMYIAEVGHGLMIAASYCSLLFCFFTTDWRMSFWIFLITAFIASLGEVAFVMVQRFNRQRMRQAMQRHRKAS